MPFRCVSVKGHVPDMPGRRGRRQFSCCPPEVEDPALQIATGQRDIPARSLTTDLRQVDPPFLVASQEGRATRGGIFTDM